MTVLCEFNQPITGASTPRWKRKARKTKTPRTGDRFIPNRESINKDLVLFQMNENTSPKNQTSFNTSLAQTLFEGDDVGQKILAFKKKAPKPKENFENNMRVIFSQNKQEQVQRTVRHISPSPEKILDAPGLVDNFYLNVLDCSSTNVIAVGLGPSIYLWDYVTGSVNLLFELPEEEYITSVSWMGNSSHLAVGTSENEVQLWNIEKQRQVRSMKGHQARVAALSWNNHVLSSGSKDSTIMHHDVRIAQHNFLTARGHEQEVCGLKWSPDGKYLASGGNDNLVCVWDLNSSSPVHKLSESKAAVKALAWSPWERNLLATGGGTSDRCIRFYNAKSGSLLNTIDTQSQISSLVWSRQKNEILSGHGFSKNHLTLWQYPSMVKVTELTGHTSRILHTVPSADGTVVCSAAADETLRFWKIWDLPEKKKKANYSTGSMLNMKFR